MKKMLSGALAALYALMLAAPAWAVPPSVPAPFSAANAIPQVINFDPANYQAAVRGFAGVIAGTRRMKIAVIGDSTTAGFGSQTGDGGYLNMLPNAWPTRLAQLLSASGTPAEVASAMGWNGVVGGATHADYDPRMSFGTGWSNAGTTTLGGQAYFIANGGGTGVLGFTPGVAFDHVRIWYVSAGSPNGSMTVNISGGSSLGTVNTNGAGGFAHTDFAASGGSTDQVRLVPNNDGQLNVLGIEVWNAASPKVQIYNFGVLGAKVADKLVSTNPWSAFGSITSLSAIEPFDLVIIDLDTNDANQNTGVQTYQANLLTLVQAWKATGAKVVLVGGAPSAGYENLRPPYIAAEKTVANATGSMFIDTTARWGTYAAGNALGLYYPDGVHLDATGYAAIAAEIADVLKRLR